MIIEKNYFTEDFTGLRMSNLSYKYFYRAAPCGLPTVSLYKWHTCTNGTQHVQMAHGVYKWHTACTNGTRRVQMAHSMYN
jgi:hypothetical protein